MFEPINKQSLQYCMRTPLKLTISEKPGHSHGFANCVVFNHLEEYYGEHVVKFKKMLEDHNINLPKNVTQNLSEEAIERMVDMTLKMERPLTNALGENWREILTRKKIRELYMMM